eukprot:Filipodium_phascolosomae@DN2725_c1_g1_i19.p1
MKQFDEYGAGAVPSYYTKNDFWDATKPQGKSYACKLVNYQTQYSMFSKNSYVDCLKKSFPEVVIEDDGPYVPKATTPPPPTIPGPSTETPPTTVAPPVGAYVPRGSYSTGDVVTHNGKVYKCLQGAWCSGNPRAYEPGLGEAWDSAWKVCPDGVCSPPRPSTGPPVAGNWTQYQPNGSYKGGDEVINNGQVYVCKANVGAWCSGDPAAYEPGVGRAWESAWRVCPKGDCSKAAIPTVPYNMTKSEIAAKVRELTSGPMMQKVIQSMAVLPPDVVDNITPLNPNNPENVKRVESMFSNDQFLYVFPWRLPVYTYNGFLKAIGKFPAFCREYKDGRDSEAVCRKSLAVMFAHFGQETGGHVQHPEIAEWRQALKHVREVNWNETSLNGYNDKCKKGDIWQTQTWPCGKFLDGPNKGEYKSYFGRGAKQLSYNFNYGPFSQFMYGSVHPLLQDPHLVADTWLNFASAVFFY